MIKMNEERIKISVNQEDVQNIINCYEKDLKELNQLQNNWNELKKWLEEDNYKVFEEIWVNTQEVLDKMQELEQGKDESN